MNPLIQLKTTPPLLIILTLLCFTLLPRVQATTDPGSVDPFNTADGDHALFSNTTGVANAAFGWYALFANTDGSNNTAVGAAALDLNNGVDNTGVGTAALLFNTTGGDNTAVGVAALETNSTGSNNTANGSFALFFNTTGNSNTAIGRAALSSNTTANENTAVGHAALQSNTTGAFNTAIGVDTLVVNTMGGANAATGDHALFSNTTGNSNTANGNDALQSNSTGSGNTAVGLGALASNTAGNNNIGLGPNAGNSVTTANNVICIGDVAGANVNNTCFIGSIRGVTTINGNALPVVIDSANQLGTTSSSRRFKHEIKAMDKASEAILALKPVTFHYKSDNTNTAQFGLIAEEVAEVNADLVVRDKDGEIYTVRYDQVNAMLLNEFLKEHKKVEEQQATITQLRKDFGGMIAHLTARVDEQAAQIQKVSAQLEASKPAPQVVENNR